jgi:hypothetical protein
VSLGRFTSLGRIVGRRQILDNPFDYVQVAGFGVHIDWIPSAFLGICPIMSAVMITHAAAANLEALHKALVRHWRSMIDQKDACLRLESE